MGRRTAGDVFVVDAQLGDELIARRVVEAATDEPAVAEEPAPKPVKAKTTAKE
ncbi:hypothetical protein PMO01_03155 [Pseudomonas moraviensis R28-S]|uniref:Uncharacterized protein n=2 Tax=Pseudomonas moraviensis TaxID=321662 RepID=V8RDZ4_9PSED|nr:hypothetical protein PMO01_03155 [Pseudomonas moraviensis R28-S]